MFEYNDCTAKYETFTHHTMIHEICLAHRLVRRIFCKRLGCAENVNTISGCLSQ